MANSIPVNFRRAYRSNVISLYQENGGKLDMIPSQIERSSAETVHFERIAPAEAMEKTVRHDDTKIVDSVHSRRTAHLKDFFWADWIDKEDRIKLIADPQSTYTRNAVEALRRKSDRLKYDALRGNALSGKDGTGIVALPSTQKVAAGGVGLTFEKTLDATTILNGNNVPFENRYFIINSAGLDDLLREAELTSRDFTQMRALETGQITSFLGYTWILYNFPIVGTDHFALACHTDSLGWAQNQAPMVEVDRLPTKHYLVQVYASMGAQAVRLQEEGVVEVAYV